MLVILTVGMSLKAKQLALSTPEELMARVEDASIRLTWFFDEDLTNALWQKNMKYLEVL